MHTTGLTGNFLLLNRCPIDHSIYHQLGLILKLHMVQATLPFIDIQVMLSEQLLSLKLLVGGLRARLCGLAVHEPGAGLKGRGLVVGLLEQVCCGGLVFYGADSHGGVVVDD